MSSAKKLVVTITGIRPDFIRMSHVFKHFDAAFDHRIVLTGQHYSPLLVDVFFDELGIRKPDHVLQAGTAGGTHYHQLGYLSTAIIELFKKEGIEPDLVVFLGDSNSVCAALPLRKEGYCVAHIEAGMRSFDKRMLEEINRTTCDHCSDLLFVYHEEYKRSLHNENIRNNVHVVGNTIVEVCRPFADAAATKDKPRDMILVDIHRPENFRRPHRMATIVRYANWCGKRFQLPVKMLKFHGTCAALEGKDLGIIELVDLMSYTEYLDTIGRKCKLLISDSGTGQEEPAMFGTPVIVPRDFTERPQSTEANCSFMLHVENELDNADESFAYLDAIIDGSLKMSVDWLGDGNTAERITTLTHAFLTNQR
jgi:UDP-N-acetylglucosamine 2-epimerase (non-hydrolysing)